MLKKSLLALFLSLLAVPSLSPAWEGKVIGIKDCRAIIVFDGMNLPVAVLLEGLERTKTCPQGAKQFVSDSVFGKKVEVKDGKKAEGGVVAEVIMPDGKSLNRELLKQDFMRYAGREAPVDASPKTPETISPPSQRHTPLPSPKSAKKDSPSTAKQYRETSAVPGIRKWRDKNGNIHFSGTAGGKE